MQFHKPTNVFLSCFQSSYYSFGVAATQSHFRDVYYRCQVSSDCFCWCKNLLEKYFSFHSRLAKFCALHGIDFIPSTLYTFCMKIGGCLISQHDLLTSDQQKVLRFPDRYESPIWTNLRSALLNPLRKLSKNHAHLLPLWCLLCHFPIKFLAVNHFLLKFVSYTIVHFLFKRKYLVIEFKLKVDNK